MQVSKRIIFPRIWSAGGQLVDLRESGASDHSYFYRVVVHKDHDVKFSVASSDVDLEDTQDRGRKNNGSAQTLHPTRSAPAGQPFTQLVFVARKKVGN